jgi:hypothetical protein
MGTDTGTEKPNVEVAWRLDGWFKSESDSHLRKLDGGDRDGSNHTEWNWEEIGSGLREDRVKVRCIGESQHRTRLVQLITCIQELLYEFFF